MALATESSRLNSNSLFVAIDYHPHSYGIIHKHMPVAKWLERAIEKLNK